MLYSPITNDYQCLRVSDNKTWWRQMWHSCFCHPQCHPLDKKKSEIYIYLTTTIPAKKVTKEWRVSPLPSPPYQMFSMTTRHNIHINVTLGHVHVTTVVVKKQKVLHIPSACSLSYSARKAHMLYHVVICGLYGSTIFFHIIIIS
jgi:hypothetical protein